MEEEATLFGHYASGTRSSPAGRPMFRVHGHELGRVIVDEEFRQAVEGGRLRGLIWRPLP